MQHSNLRNIAETESLRVLGYIYCTWAPCTPKTDTYQSLLEAISCKNPECRPLALHISYDKDILGVVESLQWAGGQQSGSSSSETIPEPWERVRVDLIAKRQLRSNAKDVPRYRIAPLQTLGPPTQGMTTDLHEAFKQVVLGTLDVGVPLSAPKKCFKRGCMPPDGKCYFHVLCASTNLASCHATPRGDHGYAKHRSVQQLEALSATECRDDLCAKAFELYQRSPEVVEKIRRVKASGVLCIYVYTYA